MALLAENLRQEALELVAPESRAMFSTVLLSLGADSSKFPKSVQRFDVTKVMPGLAIAVIIIPEDGAPQMFQLMFGQDANGEWKLSSM